MKRTDILVNRIYRGRRVNEKDMLKRVLAVDWMYSRKKRSALPGEVQDPGRVLYTTRESVDPYSTALHIRELGSGGCHF